MTISENLIRFSLSFVDVFWKGKLWINEHVSFTKLLPFSKIIMEKYKILLCALANRGRRVYLPHWRPTHNIVSEVIHSWRSHQWGTVFLLLTIIDAGSVWMDVGNLGDNKFEAFLLAVSIWSILVFVVRRLSAWEDIATVSRVLRSVFLMVMQHWC